MNIAPDTDSGTQIWTGTATLMLTLALALTLIPTLKGTMALTPLANYLQQRALKALG
jgi:hypothetical protein